MHLCERAPACLPLPIRVLLLPLILLPLLIRAGDDDHILLALLRAAAGTTELALLGQAPAARQEDGSCLFRLPQLLQQRGCCTAHLAPSPAPLITHSQGLMSSARTGSSSFCSMSGLKGQRRHPPGPTALPCLQLMRSSSAAAALNASGKKGWNAVLQVPFCSHASACMRWAATP